MALGHRRIEELVNREEIFDWDGRAFIRVWEHAEKKLFTQHTRTPVSPDNYHS